MDKELCILLWHNNKERLRAKILNKKGYKPLTVIQKALIEDTWIHYQVMAKEKEEKIYYIYSSPNGFRIEDSINSDTALMHCQPEENYREIDKGELEVLREMIDTRLKGEELWT